MYDSTNHGAFLTHILQAWEKCSVKEWNLGKDCLWNPRTRAAYRQYLKEDEVLRTEIQAHIGKLQCIVLTGHRTVTV